MASRIKIKVGEVEIEFEGGEAFIKKELINLAKKASQLKDAAVDLVAKPVAQVIAPPKPAKTRKKAGRKKAAKPKKAAATKTLKTVKAAKPKKAGAKPKKAAAKKAAPAKKATAAKKTTKKAKAAPKKVARGPIVGKMEIKTGKDLVLAGCAHLALKQGVNKFGRREVLQVIKQETGFYKKSYNTNLMAYLRQLVKDGKLNQHPDNQFSVADKTKEELKPLLG